MGGRCTNINQRLGIMEYVKVKDLPKRLEGKKYASISCTGSVRGMKSYMGGIKPKRFLEVVISFMPFGKTAFRSCW